MFFLYIVNPGRSIYKPALHVKYTHCAEHGKHSESVAAGLLFYINFCNQVVSVAELFYHPPPFEAFVRTSSSSFVTVR